VSGQLLTVQEAAARRDCTVNAIRVAISLGRLPSTGSGKDRRVRVEDVDAMRTRQDRRARSRTGGPSSEAQALQALLSSFSEDERRVLSYALYYAALSGRLYPREKPVIRRLMVRFSAADNAHSKIGRNLARTAQGIPVVEEVPEPPVHLDLREQPRAA
jgi:excisionase family DNA binding protein